MTLIKSEVGGGSGAIENVKGESYSDDLNHNKFEIVSVKEETNPAVDRSQEIKCKECGKCFKFRSRLKDHQIVHTKEKRFKCDECGKVFGQLKILKKHKYMHTGEKLFVCDICSKSFAHNYYLKLHQEIHSSEKKYNCRECGKEFSLLWIE